MKSASRIGIIGNPGHAGAQGLPGRAASAEERLPSDYEKAMAALLEPKACPVCSSRMPPRTYITCRDCWWDIPTKERMALHAMLNRGQLSEPKVRKAVRLARDAREGRQALQAAQLTT